MNLTKHLHYVLIGWDDNYHQRTIMVFEEDCAHIAWNFYENERQNWYNELQRMHDRNAAQWEIELHHDIAPSVTALFMPHVQPRVWNDSNPVQIKIEVFGLEPEFCYSSTTKLHEHWTQPAPWGELPTRTEFMLKRRVDVKSRVLAGLMKVAGLKGAATLREITEAANSDWTFQLGQGAVQANLHLLKSEGIVAFDDNTFLGPRHYKFSSFFAGE